MNRCKASRNAPILVALCTLMLPCALLFSAPAGAQAEPETEASLGGRNFPIGTLRGKLVMLDAPNIELDGSPDRLSPGARIYSAERMLVMPAAINGQRFLVNYRRDAAGLVREVWILTPEEAQAKRESAEKPLLNFWPFVASTGPRDDGKTPFDQLPKFGE
ncbi:MAG: hypothetical protein KKC79_09085 [Gammaproteobacteria bacterium]|nr:hypothetical protein [Gammaproteobacteria bacterium]